MTDNSNDQQPQPSPDFDDAAQAFEALRQKVEKLSRDVGGEITVIRKGVEAAFEQFDKLQPAPDYAEDLDKIADNLATVAEHVAAIEKSPALKYGPDQYARVLETVADRVSANVGRMIEGRSRDLERVSSNLDRYVRSARDRRLQDRWVYGAGVGGMVLGILVTLFAPRILPGSLDATVAATVMNATRWNAGIALMQAASPEAWRGIVEAGNLVRDNQEVLTACADAAAKVGKVQSCTINVGAPER